MRCAALALLFLAACSAEQAEAPVADAPVVAVERAGEWPTEFVWLRGQAAPGQAWLSFQPDESDNIQIAFECVFGSGHVSIEAFDPQRRGTELIIRSGEASSTFSAQAVRDPTGDFFGDAVRARASVPLSDPVLAAFAETGALSSGEPAIEYRLATPDELTLIQSYFTLCVG